MEVRFDLTGAERKELVRVMGEILEVKPKYLAMPTANFLVDYFLVDKEGTVSFPDDSDKEDVEYLFEHLAKRRYLPADGYFSYPEVGEECEDENFTVGLVIELPRGQFTEKSLLNLQNLLQARGTLIKKALGVPELPIEMDEEKVCFPWFPSAVSEEQVGAYTLFITKICQMAQSQKRISPKERQVTNEKYTFRCFLLRLGFIGDFCKMERKILLKNFEGSSAFRGNLK